MRLARAPLLALTVLASVLARPGRAPASVVLGRGARRELLALALDVGAPTATRLPLAWTRAGDGWVGTTHGAGWIATVTLVPADGAVALDVTLRYAAAVAVTREAIRLGLPGAARVVGRDLAFAPLATHLRIDRGTPIFVATPRVAVAGGTGFVAAEYVPGRDRVDLELLLDDAASHPFAVYEQCRDRLPPAPVDWAQLERKRPLDRLVRPAGSEVHAHATLHLLESGAAGLPLIVERWPAGARAAFVVTDHADHTDPAALRALLYGTSDRADPAYGARGLFGHGLRVTKTFFARGHTGALADDPEARALADEIVAHGSEVGAHSITEHADTRDAVRDGLGAFDPWHAVTWIDHGPYTNCEALSSRGWEADGPFAIRDLLVAHGYRWVWAATDVGAGADDLFAGDPAAARAPIFPLPVDPRLWVFRSAWLHEPPATLAARLDPRFLDALEAGRGLVVAHTYLSASERTTRLPDHRRRLAVHRTPAGTLQIDPVLDALVARLGARVAAGSLVVPTWREAGDRLRALGDVAVEYRADGTAAVVNRGPDPIAGLTLAVPAPDARLAVPGAEGHRDNPGRATVWLSLGAGARAIVRATRDGEPLPLLPGAPTTVEVQ